MKFTPPDMSKVPGGWLTDKVVPVLGCKSSPQTEVLAAHVYLVHDFMSIDTVNNINRMMKDAPNIAPVSVQGLKEVTPETTGSWRTTMFNVALAAKIKSLFAHVDFPRSRTMNQFTLTDWWQGDEKRTHWRYVGVSPMLRWMSYRAGGRHAVHYDAGFFFPDCEARTLMSFVLYLSTNQTGATRIINDGQWALPIWDRNHDDWSVDAQPEQIVAKSLPKAGNVLLFDHRIPHDVDYYDGAEGERIVIRGDLIYTPY